MNANNDVLDTAPQEPLNVLQRLEIPELTNAEKSIQAENMSDAQLGNFCNNKAKLINTNLGHAKSYLDIARRYFDENLPYYMEMKQRLLNPGYRAELNDGQLRNDSHNAQVFGAPTWKMWCKDNVVYSLQHANKKLKDLTDGKKLLLPSPSRNGRNTNDLTDQKRYKLISEKAVEAAHQDPENPVSKVILAAQGDMPMPVLPLDDSPATVTKQAEADAVHAKDIKKWLDEQLALVAANTANAASQCEVKYLADAAGTFTPRFAYSFASTSFRKALEARDKGKYAGDLKHIAGILQHGGELLLALAKYMVVPPFRDGAELSGVGRNKIMAGEEIEETAVEDATPAASKPVEPEAAADPVWASYNKIVNDPTYQKEVSERMAKAGKEWEERVARSRARTIKQHERLDRIQEIQTQLEVSHGASKETIVVGKSGTIYTVEDPTTDEPVALQVHPTDLMNSAKTARRIYDLWVKAEEKAAAKNAKAATTKAAASSQ